jgi:Transposase DDE domain
MEYNNQLTLWQAQPQAVLAEVETVAAPKAYGQLPLVCPHCQHALGENLSVPPPRKPKKRRLWVDAIEVIQLTNALDLARRAIEWTQPRPPCLANLTGTGKPAAKAKVEAKPKRKRGAPQVYSDATVLLTFLIAKLWHLSYEEMLGWLANWPRLAQTLGYPTDERTGRVRIISLGSYSKRLSALSLQVYFAFFVLLVGQLARAGIIKGYDLIVDSTIVRAWSSSDTYCAISYKYKDVNKRFGIKVHTLLDRMTGLPVMVGISPANANDSPFALPLLQAAVKLFGFKVGYFRGDAAYDSKKLKDYVTKVLKAVWAVDYNLRRKGKRQLADRDQMKRWRWFMRPRSTIERFFAWVKRYYQLKYFKVRGQSAITRHVLATYCATLFVGWVAACYRRPDLMRSPSRVLAHFDA